MDLGLKDSGVLVTGGSRGIGLESARLFAAEGARVLVCGRRESELAEAARPVLKGETNVAMRRAVGARSTRCANPNTPSAKNASAVYCFKSLRPNAAGARSTATPLATPAARAVTSDGHASERENTYAVGGIAMPNANTRTKLPTASIAGRAVDRLSDAVPSSVSD